MITVEIIRHEESEQGTIGIMKIDKEVFCFTLELPDKLNMPNESSIPTGQYKCEPYSSEKFPNVYAIWDVPGRSAILFHAGNTADDTAGCILLGSEVGKLKNDRAVLNSGATFNRFRNRIGGLDFHLTITENY